MERAEDIQNLLYLLDELETKVAELSMRIKAVEKMRVQVLADNHTSESRKNIQNLNYPKSISESFGTIGNKITPHKAE